jgi:hypothetical protein
MSADAPSRCRAVVLSRCPEDDPGRTAREGAVRDALARSGVPVLVVPHLYHLTPDHPGLERIKELGGPLGVLAWLGARASLWTLRALGVDREVALRCWDLAEFGSPEQCAQAVLAAARAGDGPVRLQEVPGRPAARWYPVIDYDRCRACGQCQEFCLFGVYSRQGGRVVAESPDECKDGCPACARVCPEGAIIFPHHRGDPAIAGALEPAESPTRPESTPDAPPEDDLDDLMDALDRLDQ